ncbi:uncharacterized protein JCM6883_003056 [Sporobolomyces salmoneus]|uniref:uncharacterized protein n=1 Tax=Sporobolomyces salmoneus TaxID=183962 RepID=UPI003180C026
MSNSSDSDSDLPHPSVFLNTLLRTPAKRSINKHSSSTSKSAARSSSSTVSKKSDREEEPRQVERRSSPRLSRETNVRSTSSVISQTPRSRSTTPQAPLEQPVEPVTSTEPVDEDKQRHLDLANELFPPSPPSLTSVQVSTLAVRSVSSANIISDSEGEGGAHGRYLLGGRREGNDFNNLQGGMRNDGLVRGEGTVISDSEDDLSYATPKPNSSRPKSWTQPSLLSNPLSSTNTPRVPRTEQKTPRPTQRSARRITISVISESSSSDDDDENSQTERSSPKKSHNVPDPVLAPAARFGQGAEEEIVVVETDDEEELPESILPVLEPQIRMNGSSRQSDGSGGGGGGFGYRGMDDVWENDGVLIYDPTPKKRPTKFSASASPSPFNRKPSTLGTQSTSNRELFRTPSASPTKNVPSNKPNLSRTTSKSPRKHSSSNDKEANREIDLTGSSSSEEDDILPPPVSRSSLSTLQTSASSKTPNIGKSRSSSPSKVPRTPSTTKSKPKPAPTTTSSSTRPLSATDRTQLPLSLIRQIDRQVFRKKWSEDHRGLKCLDQEGEYNGMGLPEGLEVVWNARLRNTAGRARWKKVKSTSPSKAGSTTIVVRHECTIELSTKVIDTELKLRNTLAHELCHIAAWVLSGEVKPPHGGAFKLWANRIMKVFPDLEITTTHSYSIVYKFRWRCSSVTCGKIFGRHSNSINVSTHGCPCGSKLVRIDRDGNEKRIAPTVVMEENERGEMIETPVKPKKKNGWLEFVATQSPVVRKERPEIPQSEVLKLVAERWKRVKEDLARESNVGKKGIGKEQDELEKAMGELRV